MQTRREQVRAYRFVTRRIVSAMLAGDPETADLPMRRLALALLASLMLATIVFAGVGAYGLLRPGGGGLPNQAIIIERETGARYVSLERTLYPVLNYASARLILGVADPAVYTMSQRSLHDLARGQAVGIPGAPDALPDRGALLNQPWSVCSAPRSVDDPNTPSTRLLVGVPLAPGPDLGDRAVLVALTDEKHAASHYLIWHNHRLRVASPLVYVALGLDVVSALPVGQALVNAIPAGPDLRPYNAANGQPTSATINGRTAKVGDLYRFGGTYYAMLPDGLTPLSDVMATIMKASTATPPQDITAKEVALYPSGTRVESAGFPTTMPKVVAVGAGTAACAQAQAQNPSGGEVSVRLFDRAPTEFFLPAPNTSGRVSDGVQAVDGVVIPGGHGELVRGVAPGSDGEGSTVYLITDQGIRYPIPAGSATTKVAPQAVLGYGDVTPTEVPASLLALIPKGPQLSPDTAGNLAAVAPVPSVVSPLPNASR